MDVPTRQALVMTYVTPGEHRPPAAHAVTSTAAVWRLPRTLLVEQIPSPCSPSPVLLWRWSANMPQLDDDGLPGFSADDWLAPVLTYVVLAAYADLRKPGRASALRTARALATIAALVVDVVTI